MWTSLGVVLGVAVAAAGGTHVLDKMYLETIKRQHQGEIDSVHHQYQSVHHQYQTKVETLQAEVATMKYLLQVTHTHDYQPLAEKLKKEVKDDEGKGS